MTWNFFKDILPFVIIEILLHAHIQPFNRVAHFLDKH